MEEKNLTKYKNEFNRQNYDQTLIMSPKGMKEVWKAEAQKRKMSLNALIIEAVKKYIEENSTNGDI